MKENTHRNRHQQQLVAQQAGRQGGGTAGELGVQGICLVCLFFELKVNVAHIKVQICFICQHKLYEKWMKPTPRETVVEAEAEANWLRDCLPVCLSLCLSAGLPVRLSGCLSPCLFVFSFCLGTGEPKISLNLISFQANKLAARGKHIRSGMYYTGQATNPINNARAKEEDALLGGQSVERACWTCSWVPRDMANHFKDINSRKCFNQFCATVRLNTNSIWPTNCWRSPRPEETE